jgi:hypothetical protein
VLSWVKPVNAHPAGALSDEETIVQRSRPDQKLVVIYGLTRPVMKSDRCGHSTAGDHDGSSAAVGQSVAQVPVHRQAHCQHDDFTGEAKPRKLDGGGSRRRRRRISSACLKLSSIGASVPFESCGCSCWRCVSDVVPLENPGQGRGGRDGRWPAWCGVACAQISVGDKKGLVSGIWPTSRDRVSTPRCVVAGSLIICCDHVHRVMIIMLSRFSCHT